MHWSSCRTIDDTSGDLPQQVLYYVHMFNSCDCIKDNIYVLCVRLVGATRTIKVVLYITRESAGLFSEGRSVSCTRLQDNLTQNDTSVKSLSTLSLQNSFPNVDSESHLRALPFLTKWWSVGRKHPSHVITALIYLISY